MAALAIIKGAAKYGPKAVKKIKEGLKRRKKKKEALKLKEKRTPQERKLLKETMNEVLRGKSNKEIAANPKMRGLMEKAKEAKAKRAFEKRKGMKAGGRVKMDGCATRGKTRGRMV